MEEQNNIVGDAKKSNHLLVIIIILVILVGVAGFWWFGQNASELVTDTNVTEETESFGSDVFDKAQQQTAEELTENIPDTNPLGNVEANPYDDYKNPFNNN